jgi:endonuclease/exonuclease/phosphatase family metal-dependent hydrolase
MFLSYISIYISPADAWIFAYFGLMFQPLFLLNLLMLVFLMILRRKIFLLQLATFLPGIFFLGDFFRLSGNSESDKLDGSLKVITYNVQMFNLPFRKSDTSYLNILSFIKVENPDILCLQEFYTAEGKLTEEEFAAALPELPYRAVFYNIRKNNSLYGIATFSKYPIKINLEIPFENSSNSAMYSDIEVGDKIIRVYNVHFQSVRLNLQRSLRRIIGGHDELRAAELEEVSTRLKTAFVKRARQVDEVAKHISVSPYPVIVCGDFNDTPVSYTYHVIKGNKKDAFCEQGRGLPSTFRDLFPSFRIDYILHDRNMEALSYKIPQVDYSDHYPVVSRIDY